MPFRSALFLFIFVALSVAPAWAQTATATLSGTVVDDTAAAIADVVLTLVNAETSFERVVTTGREGAFAFPFIAPGRYTVTAQREGFAPSQLQNLAFSVGDNVAVRIVLHVGAIADTVSVTANASDALRDATATVSTVVGREFVENMPLNGRGFLSLLTVVPGVALTATGTGPLTPQGQFSVNGQRATANYFTVDGVSANIGVNASAFLYGSGSGALPGLSALGGTSGLVAVDALEEFRIATSSYAPEFGRMPGGQVSLITRSGSNQWRGALSEYYRHSGLDASDYFTKRAGLAKPELRQHDLGSALGGPIVRDRLFFFGAYEALRLRQPRSGTSAVPSLPAREQAPGGVRSFLNGYPLPTGRDFGDGTAEYSAAYSDRGRLDAASIRIDGAPAAGVRVFTRYSDAPSSTIQRGQDDSALSVEGFVEARTRTLTGGLTQTIGSRATHDLRANWSRSTGRTHYELDDFGGARVPADEALFPGYPSGTTRSMTFRVQGLPSLIAGDTAKNTLSQINVVDTISVAAGRHLLQAGVDVRRIVSGPQYDNALTYYQWPTFSGIGTPRPGVAPSGTVLSGTPRVTSVALGKAAQLRFLNVSTYLQDVWSINRLTLSYGVRWDINPAPTGVGMTDVFALTQVDDPGTFALAPVGTPLYRTRYGNVAPRVGGSYQLRTERGRETVLRAGGGVFFDLGFGSLGGIASQFPNLSYRSVRGTTYPLSAADAAPPSLSPDEPAVEMLVADPDLRAPRTYQWNVSAEQALGARQSVTVSYIGAVGRQLLRNEYVGYANEHVNAAAIVRNAGRSAFHSAQVVYNRRLFAGLQMLASYTLSNAKDLGSEDASWFNRPATDGDPNADWGPSDFDIRHAFHATASYELPAPSRGWLRHALSQLAVDAIVTARSGAPVDLVGGLTYFPYLVTTRPDVVPGQPYYLDDPDAPGGRRFNPAAFAPTPVDESGSAIRQGTLPRNALRGFPLFQADVAVRRTLNLGTAVKLQLRLEAFNLLNTTSFASPLGDLASPLFGVSTSLANRGFGNSGATGGLSPLYQVGGPRSVQLAARLTF